MNLRRSGEVGFLRDLIRRHRRLMPESPSGPGDDAATLDRRVLTTDALLEGEHFLAGEPAFLLGRKALNVNLSDLAAMGAAPEAFLLALGVPASIDSRVLSALTDGVASAAAEHGAAWIGGDVVRSPRGIVIAVTAVGRRRRRLLTRRGASPGDGIYVTGPLGDSAAGRALLSRGWRLRSPRGTAAWRARRATAAASRLLPLVDPPRRRRLPAEGKDRRDAAACLAAHLDPIPRLAAGRFLAESGIASSAMDLSDGLSLDLSRLCEASGVGALLQEEAVPISQAARSVAGREGWDPLRLALDGGEDYEILFTAPRSKERALAGWPLDDGTGPILLGRIGPPGRGIRLADARGRSRILRARGYDPFLAGR